MSQASSIAGNSPVDLFDFTRPAFRRDPVPTYRALRGLAAMPVRF